MYNASSFHAFVLLTYINFNTMTGSYNACFYCKNFNLCQIEKDTTIAIDKKLYRILMF